MREYGILDERTMQVMRIRLKSKKLECLNGRKALYQETRLDAAMEYVPLRQQRWPIRMHTLLQAALPAPPLAGAIPHKAGCLLAWGLPGGQRFWCSCKATTSNFITAVIDRQNATTASSRLHNSTGSNKRKRPCTIIRTILVYIHSVGSFATILFA